MTDLQITHTVYGYEATFPWPHGTWLFNPGGIANFYVPPPRVTEWDGIEVELGMPTTARTIEQYHEIIVTAAMQAEDLTVVGAGLGDLVDHYIAHHPDKKPIVIDPFEYQLATQFLEAFLSDRPDDPVAKRLLHNANLMLSEKVDLLNVPLSRAVHRARRRADVVIDNSGPARFGDWTDPTLEIIERLTPERPESRFSFSPYNPYDLVSSPEEDAILLLKPGGRFFAARDDRASQITVYSSDGIASTP